MLEMDEVLQGRWHGAVLGSSLCPCRWAQCRCCVQGRERRATSRGRCVAVFVAVHRLSFDCTEMVSSSRGLEWAGESGMCRELIAKLRRPRFPRSSSGCGHISMLLALFSG